MTGVRVLVVDDQPVYRAAMASVVEETRGFRVVGGAASGEDALAAASVLGPDLVLLDVNLPGIDGAETARRLLSLAAPPVVVLLSTYDEEVGLSLVHESGASSYVPKAAFGPARLEAEWRSAGRSAVRRPS